MATQVLIAHTGQELQLDTSHFTTCVRPVPPLAFLFLAIRVWRLIRVAGVAQCR